MLEFIFLSLVIVFFGAAISRSLFSKKVDRLLRPEHLRELIGGFANLKERVAYGEEEAALETGEGLGLKYGVERASADRFEHRFIVSDRGRPLSLGRSVMLAFVLIDRLGLDPRTVPVSLSQDAAAVEVRVALRPEEQAAWRDHVVVTPSHDEAAALELRNFDLWTVWRYHASP